MVGRGNVLEDWVKEKGKLGGEEKVGRLRNRGDYIEEMVRLKE